MARPTKRAKAQPEFTLNFGPEIDSDELLRIQTQSPTPKEHYLEYFNHYLCKITKHSSTIYLERIFDESGHLADFNVKDTRTALREAYCEWTYDKEVYNKDGKVIKKDVKVAIDDWMGWAGQTRFNRIVFEPHCPMEVQQPDGHNLNLFTGYNHRYDPNLKVNEAKFKLITHHLRSIMCRDNDEAYEYLLDVLAWKVQRPREKLGKCIVLYGVPGAGKSLLMEWFGEYILGRKSWVYLQSLESLMGRFNSHLENKLLTILDECNTFAGNHKDFNRLKSMITQEYAKLEKKGKDAIQVRDCNLFVLLSNELYMVKIEASDRRYFCLHVSDEVARRKEHFEPLLLQMRSKAAPKHFFHFLMNREIKISPATQPPMTSYKKELKRFQKTPELDFMQYVLDKHEDWLSTAEQKSFMRSSSLYEKFCRFCNKEDLRNPYRNVDWFSRAVKAKFDMESVRARSQRGLYLPTKQQLQGRLRQYGDMLEEEADEEGSIRFLEGGDSDSDSDSEL